MFRVLLDFGVPININNRTRWLSNCLDDNLQSKWNSWRNIYSCTVYYSAPHISNNIRIFCVLVSRNHMLNHNHDMIWHNISILPRDIRVSSRNIYVPVSRLRRFLVGCGASCWCSPWGGGSWWRAFAYRYWDTPGMYSGN